ncbi:Oxidoreductase BOA1 [Paramyrothecium foliicola]|nr:Oxidoreductase BOA1 [Paramyrothecium foliicola]
MARIAVAGGATGLGKSVVEAINATTNHKPIVLTRKGKGDPSAIEVDYSSAQHIKEVLENNNIEAADSSNCTKRFIPSEFEIQINPQHVERSISFPFKVKTIERLERSKLDFTLIHTGFFLDYLACSAVPSPLEVQSVFLNLRCKRAIIPGSGDKYISLTHSRDIALFVASLLDVASWDKRYYAFSSRITLNGLVEMAQEVTGVTLDVTYDERNDLDQGRCSLLPPPIDDGFSDSHFD